MSDLEMMELAAKGAGIAVHRGRAWQSDKLFREIPRPSSPLVANVEWNPLTDDGDALRLAVRLNLDIEFLAEPDGVEVWVCATWSDEPVSQTEEGGKDLLAATRRAIVRAAAAIGETME